MQPRSLDEARRLFPDLGITLYAQTPRGAVTLEILDGEKTFSWVETTEARVWAVAFPVDDIDEKDVPDRASMLVEDPPLRSVFNDAPDVSDLSPDTAPAQSVFD